MQKTWISAFCLWIGLSFVLLGFFYFGIFGSWQLLISDQLFQPTAFTNSIVVLTIDDRSLQSIGRWPWSREVWSDVIKKVAPEAAVVGLDVTLSEPSTPLSDELLSQTLATYGKSVVLASELISSPKSPSTLLEPILQFAKVAQTGVVNVNSDSDGVVRSFNPKFSLSGVDRDHFAQKIAQLFHEKLSSDAKDKFVRISQERDSSSSRIWFAGPPGTVPNYSLTDVLTGMVNSSVWKNKMVLIGATAHDLHDEQLTPTSHGQLMSGVEIHANILHTILSDKQLQIEPTLTSVVTTTTALAFTIILTTALSFRFSTVGLVLGVFTYLVWCIFSFDQGVIKQLVYPPLALVIGYIAGTINRYWLTQQQKQYINKALSLYLSPSVMKSVLLHPDKLKLGGDRQTMTVLFSDIAGFTSISEQLKVEKLVQLLNHYLSKMTDLVFQHQGVLDKYIGDAVMAFWGAPLRDPQHALRACMTALAMRTALTTIRSEWKEHGIGNFDMRIGVHTGEMIVGNMGSHNRFDYTIIGDNVNLGSRLEGMNKEYGSSILISQSTYDQVRDSVITRELDTVAVKGKHQGVTVYELLGLQPKAVTPLTESAYVQTARTFSPAFLAQFSQARQQYTKGNFKKAILSFQKAEKLAVDDMATKMYLARCQELISSPPKNWDGVFHATSK